MIYVLTVTQNLAYLNGQLRENRDLYCSLKIYSYVCAYVFFQPINLKYQ